MEHKDFAISKEFMTASKAWRCTDIGTRTIIAIKVLDRDDPFWFNAPPYAVVEMTSISLRWRSRRAQRLRPMAISGAA